MPRRDADSTTNLLAKRAADRLIPREPNQGSPASAYPPAHGMDLSWDICEAYMLLGYLPPLHFCRLPQFAGWRLTAQRAWIIAGCNRSCQVAMSHAKSSLRDLRSVRHALKANNAA